VGLSGELRMVGQMNARLREAAKLGFRAAIVPRRIRHNSGEPYPEGIQIIEARSLREALGFGLMLEAAGDRGENKGERERPAREPKRQQG
jgi:DNA repair protein RadA/Sms